jgi:hypothetical protein
MPRGDQLLDHVRAWMAYPGRVSGSAAERTCQEALGGKLAELGFDARVEGAVCPAALPTILMLHAATFLAAIPIGLLRPVWGVALCVLAGASFWGELRGAPRPLRWFLSKRITGNLVARLRNEPATHKLLLVAHADVAHASRFSDAANKPWSLSRERVRGAPSGRNVHPGTLVLVAAGAEAIGLALLSSGAGAAVGWGLLVAAAVVHLAVAGLSWEWWNSPPGDGAVDNASGLAVALGIAEDLAAEPPAHIEVWVVATGDREPDAGGMRAFVRQFGRMLDPETTWVVNVDDVGVGDLAVVTGEGRWEPLPYRPTLPALAEEAAEQDERLDGTVQLQLVGTTDAGPATEAGWRAVTLTCLQQGRRPPLLHTHRDTIDAVEPAALERAWALGLALVRAVDRRVAAEARASRPAVVALPPPPP